MGRYVAGSTAVADPSDAPIFSETCVAMVRSLQACLDVISSPKTAPTEFKTDVNLEHLASRLCTYDLVAKAGNWFTVTVRESRLNDRLLEIEIQRADLTDVGFLLKSG